MKIIKTNRDEPYLTYVINGQKTVEGRLNKGKFALAQVGDVFELKLTGNKFKILRKTQYKNFKEMLLAEGIKNVLPDKTDIEEGVKVYYQFYTKDQEQEYGVVSFKVEKLTNN